jgi:hypothetical protein
MATKSTNPNVNETSEETEPEPFVNPEGDDDFNGIPGQIHYPDREVDAERAAAWAAGKEDSLYPDDEEGDRVGWQNPADRSTEVQDEETKDDE